MVASPASMARLRAMARQYMRAVSELYTEARDVKPRLPELERGIERMDRADRRRLKRLLGRR